MNYKVTSLVMLSLFINNALHAKKETSMTRKPEHTVADIFIERWSPRAMSGEEISKDELMSLFEAARWAPSSFNDQPWRFIYAQRNTPDWDKFYKLMVPFNQSWAKDAAALIVIVSRDNSLSGKPSRTHSFDTGAAWQNLALQGSLKNLVIHGMSGFDYDKAKEVLNIPAGYTVEAMVAVGKPGKKENLSRAFQERETKSDRKSIKEFVFGGSFKK